MGAFYGIGSGWVVPSDGSNVTAAECKTIIDNMANQSNFQMSGIRAGGVKYMFLSATDSVVRGKKGLGGIHCAKSKTSENNNIKKQQKHVVLRVKTSMPAMPIFL